MTAAEMMTLLGAFKDDEQVDEKILEKLNAKKNEPVPKPNETNEPNKPIKADSVITMTAAEFMQVLSSFTPKKEEEKKEEDDDAELFL